MKNKNPYKGDSWEDVEKELFTPEEIEQTNRFVKFYGVIISIRQKLGLTQREMAQIINMKQPMLARFEKGDNIPKLTTACKILKPFGLYLAITDKNDNVLYKFE